MTFETFSCLVDEKLPQKKVLFFVYTILFGSFIAANSFLSQYFNLSVRTYIYFILIGAWTSFWFFNKFYLPRNKYEKVGIVIAIFSENESERLKLKADFISELRKNFQNEGILDFSELIFLKNHFSERIHDSNNPLSEIEGMNETIKAHFYVWGDVKRRPDGDEGDKYFLNFQGYVVHRPIPRDLSQKISREFASVLPSEINFLEKRSFKGFQATATAVHLAAKYIIGLAAFVSQDPELALKLHNGLKDQFNCYRPLPPALQEIRNRIPGLLSDEALWMAKWHYYKNKDIGKAKDFLELSLRENPNNYGAWLFKAAFEFSEFRDTDEAFRSVSKAEKYALNAFEWKYSKAFLYFWRGDYAHAFKMCLKIRNQNYDLEPRTLQEVRAFNLNLLKNVDSKPQLYFWMGFLSFFKERNLEQALSDFEKFEESSDSSMVLLKQKSSAYLLQIRQEIER